MTELTRNFLFPKTYENLTKEDKNLLYLITALIDIYLILLFFDDTHRLVRRDQNYIIFVLSVHLGFYYVLYHNYNGFLEHMHLLMMISLLYGLVAESLEIQYAILALVMTIQILWVYKEKCIMMPNEKSKLKKTANWGFGKHFSTMVIVYTVILSLRIGYRFAYDTYA